MAKKNESKKTNAEKIARQAGKAAAKAERSATEAMERARAISAYLGAFFGRPIGAVLHAGQERVEQLGEGVSNLLAPTGVTESASEVMDDVRTAVEERWRAIVHELGMPTRDEYEALKARLAELEAGEDAKRRPQRPGGKLAAKPDAKALPKAPAKAAAKPKAKGAAPKAKPAPKSVRASAPKVPAQPAPGSTVEPRPVRTVRRTGSGN